MKLYLTHSGNYDFRRELYEPLKRTIGLKHDIFYPHDDNHKEGVKSKDIIATCDIILAEVSLPSTGQGIELGWADSFQKPIICFYKEGSVISGSLRFVTTGFITYTTVDSMISGIERYLGEL